MLYLSNEVNEMACMLVHGSGQKATSWNETVSHMKSSKDILCPNLHTLLDGQEATYANLYAKHGV